MWCLTPAALSQFWPRLTFFSSPVNTQHKSAPIRWNLNDTVWCAGRVVSCDLIIWICAKLTPHTSHLTPHTSHLRYRYTRDPALFTPPGVQLISIWTKSFISLLSARLCRVEVFVVVTSYFDPWITKLNKENICEKYLPEFLSSKAWIEPL